MTALPQTAGRHTKLAAIVADPTCDQKATDHARGNPNNPSDVVRHVARYILHEKGGQGGDIAAGLDIGSIVVGAGNQIFGTNRRANQRLMGE